MSYADFSKAIKEKTGVYISASGLHKYVIGKRQPSTKNLEIIARYAGIKFQNFFKEVTKMPNDLESLTKDLSDITTKIGEATGAIAIYVDYNRMSSIMVQLSRKEFEKLFDGMEARTVEIGTSFEYPYQKQVDIGGVKFFALYPAEQDKPDETVSA